MYKKLLIKYLSTGDFPLELRMQSEIPTNLEKKISLCTEMLYNNGVLPIQDSINFVESIF
jgi:hypothetical protein